MAFWEEALEVFRQEGVTLFQNVNPSKEHWLSAGSGVSYCPYNLIVGKSEARVEIGFQRASAEENKWLFDQLFAEKEKIEQEFGVPLAWKRLDDRKSSRVEYAISCDGHRRENWPEISAWMVEHIIRLERAFGARLQALNRALKTGNGRGEGASSDQ